MSGSAADDQTAVTADVLDRITDPVPLRVIYGTRFVFNGADFRPSSIATKPRVEMGGDDLRTFYTLVMVDPDAPNPSNPTLKEYLYWLVTDIPGSTDTSFGRETVCYESPSPAVGIHRIVFVLLRQLGRKTVFEPELRHNFNTRRFAVEYHLVAVAVTYFNCQREGGTGGRRFRS